MNLYTLENAIRHIRGVEGVALPRRAGAGPVTVDCAVVLKASAGPGAAEEMRGRAGEETAKPVASKPALKARTGGTVDGCPAPRRSS